MRALTAFLVAGLWLLADGKMMPQPMPLEVDQIVSGRDLLQTPCCMRTGRLATAADVSLADVGQGRRALSGKGGRDSDSEDEKDIPLWLKLKRIVLSDKEEQTERRQLMMGDGEGKEVPTWLKIFHLKTFTKGTPTGHRESLWGAKGEKKKADDEEEEMMAAEEEKDVPTWLKIKRTIFSTKDTLIGGRKILAAADIIGANGVNRPASTPLKIYRIIFSDKAELTAGRKRHLMMGGKKDDDDKEDKEDEEEEEEEEQDVPTWLKIKRTVFSTKDTLIGGRRLLWGTGSGKKMADDKEEEEEEEEKEKEEDIPTWLKVKRTIFSTKDTLIGR